LSLRARIALAAGVAVALAVIAVAVASYEGTRSQLQGQVDQSLRSLTGSVLAGAGLSANGRPALGPGGPGRPQSGPPNTQSSSSAGQQSSTSADHNNNQSSTSQQSSASAARGSGLGLFAPGSANADARKDHDEGLGLDERRGPAFGGAAGTVTLVHANGVPYAPPGQKQIPVDSRARALAASGHGTFVTNMTVSGTRIRVMASGIGWRGALLVALPLKDVDNALHNQLLLLALISAGGILLAAVLGLLVARTALAPIGRFTRETEAIADNPDRLESDRLSVEGGDELARLAQTFNRTLDALEQSVQAQRNLVADASHELRTPIATIRANLQLMRDEELLTPEDRQALRADVIDELDELTALVGDVVELARGSKPNGEPGDVRLDEIVTAAVERTRRRAPELTVVSSIEPTLVSGEGDRIARAVTNLLDNAIKWSPPGETIEVGLHDGTVTVRDHGPGFHQEDLPYVFDRFHRARDARSKPGSGLGLAIVKQAADAHGGSVQAANAPDGGALMTISFGPQLDLAEAGLSPVVRH
jgi:two-component system sensor histidine kinase MprB